MKELKFEQLDFYMEDQRIKVVFMNHFFFYIDCQLNIKDKNTIEIKEKDEQRFNKSIRNGLNGLRLTIDQKRAYYIDKNTAIPLIGANYFGIVDRGTNIIEVKPITGCNLNCIFCSVDEGRISKKQNHIVVECDYLAEEADKIIGSKKNQVTVYINPHGEPLLYSDLNRLVKNLSRIKKVENIALITNGTLLDEKKTETLIECGLTMLNISLNAVTQEKADMIAGNRYPVEKVLDIVRKFRQRIKIILSPVIVDQINDSEIEKIVGFASENKEISLGIQNFLRYKRGRNPGKQIQWEKFNSILEDLESRYKVNLKNPGIKILPDTKLPRPYKADEIVECEVRFPGRFPNEYLCTTPERCITVRTEKKPVIGKKIKVKIIKNKDNIYFAVF